MSRAAATPRNTQPFWRSWLVWASPMPQRPQRAGERSPWMILTESGLFPVALALLLFGVVMVTSASMPVAEYKNNDPFYYLYRQGSFAVLALFLGALVMHIPIAFWERMGPLLLLAGVILLLLVLIPGIGKVVNGARRWIPLGLFNLQPSELVKFATVVYLSSYLVRHREEVQLHFAAFIRPVVLLTLVATLILVEPDFGAFGVLMVIVLSMMFLARIPLLQVGLLVGIVSGLAAIMPFVFPHVMRRIEAFLADPFLIDPQGANYQITQALIAYGRGGFDGVGLGGSVQKMFYLPEAHTDFLFAVIAEEFGFIGTGLVILAFAYVVWKAFAIGQRALACGQGYAAHLAHGLGIWVGVQAFINIGVNTHLLPNTGMTLPLMSYGGTSLLLSAVVIALLLRIEHELCPAQRRIARVSAQGERKRGGDAA